MSRKLVLAIASMVFAIYLLAPSSKAQEEVVLIRMEPVSLTLEEGELFDITVQIDNMPADPGMVGVQFKITWDAAVLNGVNMTEVLYHSVMPNETEIAANLWQLQHNVAAGYVEYAYTFFNISRAIENGYAPIYGNHTVAIITLNATTTIGLTPLEFSILKIGGYNVTSETLIALVDYPRKPLPSNYRLIESTVTVGNPPPTITITSPKNVTYGQSPINLTFTLSEPAQWIGYSLDAQANVTITGNTTIPVSDGPHNLKVYANDTDGNMGNSSTVYFTVDTAPPNITDVSQDPPENNVLPEDEVKINATITDYLSQVTQVTLNFTNGNGTWITIDMTPLETNVWNATIPPFEYCTYVNYTIVAEDSVGNIVTTEELGYELQYHVIPEFPSFLILALFMIATLLAVIVHKRKYRIFLRDKHNNLRDK